MTTPDQPALSREELEGLLGKGAQRHVEGEAHAARSDDGDAARAARSDGGDAASGAAVVPRGGPAPGAVPAAAEARAPEAEELRMALGHWERTVAELRMELIELRSRVARLEQQLHAEPETGATQADAGDAASDTAAGAATRASSEPANAEPSVLSRVRTHRSRRGWF